MDTPMISLIIPMYNEGGIIKDTARTLDKYMKENFSEYEMLFSDDGSGDGSGEMVRELGLPNVRVIGYSENKGKGAAVRYAMLQAHGDIIIFTDADLAYGTEVIKKAYDTMTSQPEISMLIGSRNMTKDGYEGYTAIRRIASKLYIRVLCIVGGFDLSDSQCGFKAFRANAARDIFSRARVNGFAFDFESILWAKELGFKISEIPVKIINHRASTVNVFKDSFKMLRDIYKIRRHIDKERKADRK